MGKFDKDIKALAALRDPAREEEFKKLDKELQKKKAEMKSLQTKEKNLSVASHDRREWWGPRPEEVKELGKTRVAIRNKESEIRQLEDVMFNFCPDILSRPSGILLRNIKKETATEIIVHLREIKKALEAGSAAVANVHLTMEEHAARYNVTSNDPMVLRSQAGERMARTFGYAAEWSFYSTLKDRYFRPNDIDMLEKAAGIRLDDSAQSK